MKKTSIINMFNETENRFKEVEKKMKDPRDEEIKDLEARLDFVKEHSTQVLKMIEDLEKQDKKKYNEEEVKHIISEALQSALVKVDLEQWFKQFKKK